MNASSSWIRSFNSDRKAAINAEINFIYENPALPKILQDKYLTIYFYFFIVCLWLTYRFAIVEQILAKKISELGACESGKVTGQRQFIISPWYGVRDHLHIHTLWT